MKKELPIDIIKDETDFLKIAQLYKDQRGEKEYLERVKDILQMDNLVYHLYGLSYNEVLIIDLSTSITKEEYENKIL